MNRRSRNWGLSKTLTTATTGMKLKRKQWKKTNE
jgi:hypothetical protein